MLQLQIIDFTKQNLADILTSIKIAKKLYPITCYNQYSITRIRDDDISEYQVLRIINRHKQLILKDQDTLQKQYERKQSRIMINPYESSILELGPQKQEKKEKSQYWKLNESTKDALKLSECKVNMLQQTLTNINKIWQDVKDQNNMIKLQIQSHFIVDALESPTRIKITEHNFKMKPHQSYFRDIQQQKIPQMQKELPLLEGELIQLQNKVRLLEQCDIQKLELEIQQYKEEIQQLVQVKGYLQQEYNKVKDQNIFMSIQIEDILQNKQIKDVIKQFKQQKQDQQEKKLVDGLNLFISLNPSLRYMKRCTTDEFDTIDMPYDDEDSFIKAVQKKYQLKNDKLEQQYKSKKQEYQQKIQQLQMDNLNYKGQINLIELNERSENKKNMLKQLQEQLQKQDDIEKQANQDLKLAIEKIQWIQKISPIRLKTQQ
ncbi:hypothetical protein pb186bvf_010316 [Paramecium bursaria]